VDVDGGFKESNSTARGQHGLIIKNTPVGNVGVTVCYDLRFPELYTALRDAGAQVILFTGTLYPDSIHTASGQILHRLLFRSERVLIPLENTHQPRNLDTGHTRPERLHADYRASALGGSAEVEGN
jgi:hypothetical protein